MNRSYVFHHPFPYQLLHHSLSPIFLTTLFITISYLKLSITFSLTLFFDFLKNRFYILKLSDLLFSTSFTLYISISLINLPYYLIVSYPTNQSIIYLSRNLSLYLPTPICNPMTHNDWGLNRLYNHRQNATVAFFPSFFSLSTSIPI